MVATVTHNNGTILSYEAGEAIGANLFLKDIGDNTYDLCDTEGEASDGVSLEAAASGEEVAVVKDGIPLVTSGGALSPGDEVMTSSAGKALVATAGNTVLGRVTNNSSATGADELVAIELYKKGQSTVAGSA